MYGKTKKLEQGEPVSGWISWESPDRVQDTDHGQDDDVENIGRSPSKTMWAQWEVLRDLEDGQKPGLNK